MTLFRRRSWTIADVPDLKLRDEGVCVDIGFLGGDEHRAAFAAIFAKLLRDNSETLTDINLLAVHAKRAVAPASIGAATLPSPLALLDVDSLALGLYDSRNKKVILSLAGPYGTVSLGIRFDNPEFWLDRAAA